MSRTEPKSGLSAVARRSWRIEGEGGFSLLETIIATGLMMVVTASVFSVMHPSQGSFSTEPEVADMQQRLRVGSDTLSKDIVMAGAGAYLGTQVGSLNYFFAPVLPFRQGASGDDGVGNYFDDRITLLYVPSTTAQSTLSTALAAGAGATTLTVNAETDCPLDGAGVPQKLCGFTKDMLVLVFDSTGNYDTFTVTAVNDASATMTVNRPSDSLTTTYPVGSKVIEVASHTYYLKTDNANQVYQLMHYDGTTNSDVPVVDHVVGLKFEYYGDPQPPTMRKALTDPTGPWTTYGPKPPNVGVANCVFTADAPTPLPVLPALGDGGQTLVQLTAAQLTDGPWCPDAANLNRWDADLLRIRKVAVTLRVETADSSLRGPASVLFTHGGTSIGGNKWVPDQEMRFQIAPRNMNLGR